MPPDDAAALVTLADQARRLQTAAEAGIRRHPGHPSPRSLAAQARKLARAASWFARESAGTRSHALPLVRARLRALTTELEKYDHDQP